MVYIQNRIHFESLHLFAISSLIFFSFFWIPVFCSSPVKLVYAKKGSYLPSLSYTYSSLDKSQVFYNCICVFIMQERKRQRDEKSTDSLLRVKGQKAKKNRETS